MALYTLGRHERLRSDKAIGLLFASGQRFSRFPVAFVWTEINREDPATPPVMVMFSAPKKKFPKAVDRNRIKRLLKEAYRLNKPDLFSMLPPDRSFHLAVIYTATEILSFEEIQKSVRPALERWAKSLMHSSHSKHSSS